MSNPRDPKSVQIVTSSGGENTHSVELNDDELTRTLLKPSLKNKKVVVVSVVGTYRKGKSFLLDFFLRYMNAKVKSDWLGDPNEPLTGFHWRCGSERDTTGIHIWSEPFLCILPSGEEVAVLFLDTQGSFDSETNMQQAATIFALTTMLSSQQIYNIKDNLQEDYLQHLQFFTEYGRIALESGCSDKPFQHLEFLIRDWPFVFDHPYGSIGGTQLLEKRFQVNENTPKENAALREHIKCCFDDVQCYLMPHPGRIVASSPTFNGRLSDMEPEFVEQLRDYVPHVLDPSRLKVKTINGQMVTCRELVEYLKAYVKIFQGDGFPKPVSIYSATAEANNLNASNSSRDLYVTEMNEVCGPRRAYMAPRLIDEAHLRIQAKVLEAFTKMPKMGRSELSDGYKEKLVNELDTLFTNYQMSNLNKSTTKHFKTPMVLLACIFAFYLLIGFLDAIGLSIFSNALHLIFWILLITLGTWMFIRVSGHGSEIGQYIDEMASGFADQVILPTVAQVGQQVAEKAIGVSPHV